MNSNYGFIYAGDYTNQRKYGVAKLGMTLNSPSARRASIQNTSGHKYRQTCYIRIKNVSKQDLLFVESWCRRVMSQHPAFTYIADSNDHFSYSIEDNHYNMRELWGECVMNAAIDCLRFMGYAEDTWAIKNCN